MPADAIAARPDSEASGPSLHTQDSIDDANTSECTTPPAEDLAANKMDRIAGHDRVDKDSTVSTASNGAEDPISDYVSPTQDECNAGIRSLLMLRRQRETDKTKTIPELAPLSRGTTEPAHPAPMSGVPKSAALPSGHNYYRSANVLASPMRLGLHSPALAAAAASLNSARSIKSPWLRRLPYESMPGTPRAAKLASNEKIRVLDSPHDMPLSAELPRVLDDLRLSTFGISAAVDGSVRGETAFDGSRKPTLARLDIDSFRRHRYNRSESEIGSAFSAKRSSSDVLPPRVFIPPPPFSPTARRIRHGRNRSEANVTHSAVSSANMRFIPPPTRSRQGSPAVGMNPAGRRVILPPPGRQLARSAHPDLVPPGAPQFDFHFPMSTPRRESFVRSELGVDNVSDGMNIDPPDASNRSDLAIIHRLESQREQHAAKHTSLPVIDVSTDGLLHASRKRVRDHTSGEYVEAAEISLRSALQDTSPESLGSRDSALDSGSTNKRNRTNSSTSSSIGAQLSHSRQSSVGSCDVPSSITENRQALAYPARPFGQVPLQDASGPRAKRPISLQAAVLGKSALDEAKAPVTLRQAVYPRIVAHEPPRKQVSIPPRAVGHARDKSSDHFPSEARIIDMSATSHSHILDSSRPSSSVSLAPQRVTIAPRGLSAVGAKRGGALSADPTMMAGRGSILEALLSEVSKAAPNRQDGSDATADALDGVAHTLAEVARKLRGA